MPDKTLKDKLEKLRDVLVLMDTDKPSYADLAKYFSQLTKVLQSHAEKVDKILTQSEKNTVKELESFTKQIEKYRAEKKGENGRDGRNGINGKDADEEKIIEEAVDTLERNLPAFGPQFRDGLELLKDEERLDASAIKNLEKLIKRLMDDVKFKTVTIGGGGGATAGGGRIVKSYDITSALNGVTKTFSLPAFYRIISVHSSSFPNAFRPIVDYTSDASLMQITFTDAITADTTLAEGQTIIITYAE